MIDPRDGERSAPLLVTIAASDLVEGDHVETKGTITTLRTSGRFVIVSFDDGTRRLYFTSDDVVVRLEDDGS